MTDRDVALSVNESPGTFLHFEARTSHSPGAETDGESFVFHPAG
jgi:hypothetical protein